MGEIMKLKEDSFIIAICLFPMTLLLLILRLTNFLKSDMYYYLILIMGFVFLITFIISLFYIVDEVINSKNWQRIFFVLLIPLIYLPIYYVKYVNSEDKYLGYILPIVNLGLIFGLYFSFNSFFRNYYVNKEKDNIVLKKTFKFLDKNEEFTINVDNTYTCNNNLGDYAIACDRSVDDSFIGIYSYKEKEFSEAKLDVLKEYHFDEIVDIIEENGYETEIEEINEITLIKYSNMEVLFTQKQYYENEKVYSLIIIKECPSYDDNLKDFEKMIKTIEITK